MDSNTFEIQPIGWIRTELATIAETPKYFDESTFTGTIHIDPAFREGLDGIVPGDTIAVLFWMHQAGRSPLKVHPRGDRTRPKRGVFSTRSPMRPNPIGLSELLVLAVGHNEIEVQGVDVIDGTPVIDIKSAKRLAPRTCVSPQGHFVHGVHTPTYNACNLRENDYLLALGQDDAGNTVLNGDNFPPDDISVPEGETVIEIPNPFSFRGATFICSTWADARAENPDTIRLSAPPPVSFGSVIKEWFPGKDANALIQDYASLPRPVRLALATQSTDARDLMALARISCNIMHDGKGCPVGLRYRRTKGHGAQPVILDEDLFEAIANNPYLPDPYKEVMVLRPGVQGGSEIMGEFTGDDGRSHVFEYLRRNSYIPWGHYAANMANDAIRYSVADLSATDMEGMRHLYYQRTFVRIAQELGVPLPEKRKQVCPHELEALRHDIITALDKGAGDLTLTGTLWGWNYGFDFAPSGYRLHASHQMLHQQFAMLPAEIPCHGSTDGNRVQNVSPRTIATYGCGDMVAAFISQYRQVSGRSFFAAYEEAIRTNARIDARNDREAGLIIHEDDHVLLFVPKAQTSPWELQLMTRGTVGNIVEANTEVRAALDLGILLAVKILGGMGARMITSIEFSKRITGGPVDQRLLYSFLPKLPYSPGAFSEAQYRYISGHYPEDFAAACRKCMLANSAASL